MDSGVGIIADYKYTDGPNKGKVFRKRFETIESFVQFDNRFELIGKVKLLNTKVVDSERVYWDYRWTAVKA